MKRCTPVLVALATVTAAVAVTVGAGLLVNPASASATDPLPADSAAAGYVGLCNEAGQNVTGGSIDSRPFIWKAVASVPPPAGYQGHGQNAVLGIFQPRSGTTPIEWGGTSFTAASYYKQKKAPAAQSTYADRSLRSVIKRYPSQVDGLYVLRMYFGRAGYGNYTATYPSTTIQVTGTTWRVVHGGTVNCHMATAVSNEQLTGVAGVRSTTPRKPSTAQRTVDSAHAKVISVPAADVRSAVRNGAGSSPSDGSSATTPAGNAALNSSPVSDTTQSSASSSWLVWVLAGLVAVLALALAVVGARRRSTSGS